MKIAFIIIISLLNTIVFSFRTHSTEDLSGNWIEGKINEDGSVTKADVSRGGFYKLSLNSDSTTVFAEGFNCGFGAVREGTWSFLRSDSTIILDYHKGRGYMNNSNATREISFQETYKVIRITRNELILQLKNPTAGKINYPFIRNLDKSLK